MSEDPKPLSAGSPAAPGLEALAELETALREATGLLKSLKAENERLKRQNAGPAALAPASELAGRVMELEELRRGWLRDRRRLAERVEGILDKLEYLQSESNSN